MFPLFLACNYSNKLLIVTLLLLAGDVEVNPGPGGSSFPCGLCEIYAIWSNGGIACEHCDEWYHMDCARLTLSSFNRRFPPGFGFATRVVLITVLTFPFTTLSYT